ncbi:MAG: acetamidase/formamidase family protein [Gemmatimonadota bacterium]
MIRTPFINSPGPHHAGRARPLAVSLPLLVCAAVAACTQADPPPSVAADSTPPAAAAEGTADGSSAQEPDYTLSADRTHNRFSRTIAPTLRVPSGAVVEVFTKEATDGQLSPESTADDLAALDFDPIHPLTGPVYVEGAEPGDVLAVTLHEIELGDWGWAAVVPGFGFLAEEFPQPWLRTWRFEGGQDVVRFADGVELPLRPFPGVMGVAPATDSLLVTIPPRANGGNMDNHHLVEGTTVYFPVFVPGALFSVGDTHAVQGDGEVSGTAIEAPMRIVYEVNVVNEGRRIPEPQYETDDYYAVTAFATTLDEAAKKATRYMIDYLVEARGMHRTDAYVLCSLAGDLKISEVVDVPHVLVSMHMPKGIFTN